ncbi:polysaccharide deacetylase family protein [Streptomyces sp. NPDC005899]|uniref:polysaccharide deacetylase family protein n=1 Tax=Streptomyces sp. NPDC005899 TaxID=3155716 RepID=UPI0033D28FD2
MMTATAAATAVAVLGSVLAGCGAPERTRTEAVAPPAGSTIPADESSAPPAGAVPSATAEAGQGQGQGPPTMAPGPAGTTPVFERRAEHAPGGADKVVALTFDADMTADQGPRAAAGEQFDNPPLIALLRRLKVPSTVFMTGRWAREYPSQARAIGNDPLFEVANHSYSHYAFSSPCYGLPTVAESAMRGEVERAFTEIRRTGARNVVPYFRFPGGCYDDVSLKALASTGVTAVQWDVVSGDAFATDAGAVAEQVLDGVRPGSLVVMHCTRSAAPVTEDAVRRVVPELRRRGYRFVKVSELMRG